MLLHERLGQVVNRHLYVNHCINVSKSVNSLHNYVCHNIQVIVPPFMELPQISPRLLLLRKNWIVCLNNCTSVDVRHPELKSGSREICTCGHLSRVEASFPTTVYMIQYCTHKNSILCSNSCSQKDHVMYVSRNDFHFWRWQQIHFSQTDVFYACAEHSLKCSYCRTIQFIVSDGGSVYHIYKIIRCAINLILWYGCAINFASRYRYIPLLRSPYLCSPNKSSLHSSPIKVYSTESF